MCRDEIDLTQVRCTLCRKNGLRDKFLPISRRCAGYTVTSWICQDCEEAIMEALMEDCDCEDGCYLCNGTGRRLAER